MLLTGILASVFEAFDEVMSDGDGISVISIVIRRLSSFYDHF